jgi:hypothetical protein
MNFGWWWVSAHSAYTFAETANCIKKAFTDIQHVEVLFKFINFTKAVEPMLNVAAQTEGLYLNPKSISEIIKYLN